MSEPRESRLERFLELTARRVSGGQLHPLEILERVQASVEGGARDGVVANDIVIQLNPEDYLRYRVAFPQLQDELNALLDDLERDRGFRRVGARRVRFGNTPTVAQGMVAVSTRFIELERSTAASAIAGEPTRRLTRHRGVQLVFGDGHRIPLTHTPFTLGRSNDNDVMLASLSVSRHHAQVERVEGGFRLRDRGSRNGIVVDGVHVDEVQLDPGVVATLGDVTVRLERME